jgi:hypothetical protein
VEEVGAAGVCSVVEFVGEEGDVFETTIVNKGC